MISLFIFMSFFIRALLLLQICLSNIFPAYTTSPKLPKLCQAYQTLPNPSADLSNGVSVLVCTPSSSFFSSLDTLQAEKLPVERWEGGGEKRVERVCFSASPKIQLSSLGRWVAAAAMRKRGEEEANGRALLFADFAFQLYGRREIKYLGSACMRVSAYEQMHVGTSR